jgi:hypothetical protein
MEPKKPKGKTLRELTRHHLAKGEIGAFVRELFDSSDRACALLGAAVLDRELTDLIGTMLIDHSDATIDRVFFARDAVLPSFASRIDMSHSMGLISDDYRRELSRIRRIRNAFAHASLSVQFTEHAIKSECENLTMKPLKWSKPDDGSPRMRFMLCVLALLQALAKRTGAVEQPNQTQVAERVAASKVRDE